MELRHLIQILLRRWWLVLIVPLVMLPILLVRIRTQPYQTTVRATVLIPGDTEIPGSSERPELMVLDDLPVLVSSSVFAQAVVDELATKDTDIGVDAVKESLAGSRYSRILTIAVTRDDRDDALAIAEAAGAVLPAQVNRYLVADASAPATVNVIDPPGDPTRSRPNQWLILFAQLVVATAAGIGIALLAHQFDRAESEDAEIRGSADVQDLSGAAK